MKTPVVMPSGMSDPQGKESWEQTGSEGNKSLVLGLPVLSPHSGAPLPQKCSPKDLPAYKGGSPLHCPHSPLCPHLPLSPNVL